MISLREEVTLPSPPDAVWPLLCDPAIVASCIPGAELTKSGDDGKYQGTMRVKFGPTVATFRGEARLAYDHAARRCTIDGRGIDGRGASRANAQGVVVAEGDATTVLKVEGNFTVTGPLETFANAGGVHIARAILAEFAENMGKLVAARAAPHPSPLPASGAREQIDPSPRESGERERLVAARREGEGPPRAAALSGTKILWRALQSWLRQLFSKEPTR
ncbi:MAG TPA: SRPBCC family protein [Stellaceae bacterium]|jgi:carbon monoxide dehydrogenase subunit G|nr:SRPBCC family protein [Stellaceae bacterium]